MPPVLLDDGMYYLFSTERFTKDAKELQKSQFGEAPKGKASFAALYRSFGGTHAVVRIPMATSFCSRSSCSGLHHSGGAGSGSLSVLKVQTTINSTMIAVASQTDVNRIVSIKRINRDEFKREGASWDVRRPEIQEPTTTSRLRLLAEYALSISALQSRVFSGENAIRQIGACGAGAEGRLGSNKLFPDQVS